MADAFHLALLSLFVQCWQAMHASKVLAVDTTGKSSWMGSRTVAAKSQATYLWWKSKPEFRALRDRKHGCW
eukprot:7970366-Heterocapsa_arctica.AAC.1